MQLTSENVRALHSQSVIKQRIRKLQQAGKRHEAQALAYAVEAEMAARRVARESRFPKSDGLVNRDAHKAARLDELRPAFKKAYDRLRYVRRVGLPEVFAQLCAQRLLTQAWGVLLEMPPPAGGGVTRLPTIVADAQVLLPFRHFAESCNSQRTCPNRSCPLPLGVRRDLWTRSDSALWRRRTAPWGTLGARGLQGLPLMGH